MAPVPLIHRVGWMTPAPGKLSWAIGMGDERPQVAPSSRLMSTKESHTAGWPGAPADSTDAGESQVASGVTIGGFLTGPRPPTFPGTSSVAGDQSRPSSERRTQVDPREMGRPAM